MVRADGKGSGLAGSSGASRADVVCPTASGDGRVRSSALITQLPLLPVTTESWRDNALQASLLSLRLLVYSLVGVVGGMLAFWIPRYFVKVDDNLWIDPKEHTPIILVVKDRLIYDELSVHAVWDLPFVYYLPVSFLLFARAGPKLSIKVLAIAMVMHGFFFMSRWKTGVGLLTKLLGLLPSAGLFITLKLSLPGDSNLPSHVLEHVVLLQFGFVMISVFNLLPADETWANVSLIVVFYPVYREASLMINRNSVRRMTLSAHTNGVPANGGRDVAREYCWLFFMWIQLGVSLTSRLAFSNLNSTVLTAMIVVLQSGMEVSLRMSMELRARWMLRLLDRLRRARRALSTKSPSVSPGDAVEPGERPQTVLHVVTELRVSAVRVTSETWSSAVAPRLGLMEWATAHAGGQGIYFSSAAEGAVCQPGDEASVAVEKAFWSMLLCGEMLSEYVAILLTFTILVVYKNKPMLLPFEYFSQMADSGFREDVSLDGIIKSTVMQVVGEVLVDSICSFYETRNGYSLVAMWNGRPRHFWLMLAAASWFASACTLALALGADDMTACHEKDLCCCVGAGLRQGAIRYKYCAVLYPNSTEIVGRPATCFADSTMT